MTLPDHLQKIWDEAFANPGTEFSVGRTVVCEGCDVEYTDKPDRGGIIAGSYAYGPCCAPRHLASMREFNEMSHLRATCPDDQSFADFVRSYRGPDAGIKITSK